jgi:hypothetical protein
MQGECNMPQTLDAMKYYYAMALFILAKHRLAEIQQYESELIEILSDKNGKAGDSIYDPARRATREGFNEMLRDMGIDVDWKKG